MNPRTLPVANLVNQIGFRLVPGVFTLGLAGECAADAADLAPVRRVSRPSSGWVRPGWRSPRLIGRRENLFSIRGALAGEALEAYDVDVGLIDRARA